MKKLKDLQEENQCLKQIVADLSLDKQILQDVLKKCWTARQLKVSAQFLIDQYNVSERKACLAILLPQSTFRKMLRRRDNTAVRARIKEISAARVRYDHERVFKLLRREGWPDKHNRVRRIYREEGLNLMLKRPKKSEVASHRIVRPEPTTVHECWAMDFVHD